MSCDVHDGWICITVNLDSVVHDRWICITIYEYKSTRPKKYEKYKTKL